MVQEIFYICKKGTGFQLSYRDQLTSIYNVSQYHCMLQDDKHKYAIS